MSVAYRDIARVLDGARRRQVRVVALGALGFGLAGALLCLFGGAVALALGARVAARAVALGAAVVAGVAAAVWAIRALLRTAWSDEAVARTVGAGEPLLRSDLVSSVELGRERDDIERTGRFSVALLDAHVAGTAERARAVDLEQAVPDRVARMGALALLLVAVLNGGAFIFGAGSLARGWVRLLAGVPGGAAARAVDPITGDIELTYRYPAYMRREPRTLSGTGGEIRAPKGTEVALRTRADRKVVRAEVEVEAAADPGAIGTAAEAPPSRPPPAHAGGGGGPPSPRASGERGRTTRVALKVSGDRDLSGQLMVTDGGSYRFRFLDARGRTVAEGPALPIAVEPDAYPEVRVTAPDRQVEVDAGAVVRIDWQAEDDVGLDDVALVVTPPGGEERRRVLRKSADARREAGTFDLDLAPEKLSEGEELHFRVEARDDDAISGPKTGVSDTFTVKIYSEAEHRRAVLERARKMLDEAIALLADRLETFAAGSVATPERFPLAEQLDARTRQLHEGMRTAAREIRRDRAGPREVAAALDNVAGQVRVAEQRLSAARAPVAQAIRIRIRPDGSLVRTMAAFDGLLDGELEKGILYLEQLLDKQRAGDLVRLAKDLAGKRRELASLLERYRAAPSEAAKKELLARISRMKDRVKELLARMSEAAKGFNDEHMNAEALAELKRSQDLGGGLDELEQLLAKGDVEGAMKALDRMASTMDQLLAGMQRTSRVPDEKTRALMKEMLAFKEQLEQVKREQEQVARETGGVKKRYQDALSKRTRDAEERVKRLEKLAGEARRDVEAAQPGVTYRAEPEYDESHGTLADLERALGMRELLAAYETAQRAAPAVERLARFLEEDVALSEHNPAMTRREPEKVRDAEGHARLAVPKARQIRDELARLFPDPRQVLGEKDQQRLQDLSRQQDALEKKAGDLQRRLQELAQKAPIFPPEAQGELSSSRGHMGNAASQLGNRNPQRGHGEQELALDGLARFQKGLEEMSKKGQGQGGEGGFPFPFGESSGGQEGEGFEASRERVDIPGAEAHKVPEEFRRDLLEAMKQGTPERYRGDVQRYYEELVK